MSNNLMIKYVKPSLSKILFIAIAFIVLSCSREDNGNQNRGQMGYTPTVEVIQSLTGALPLEERLTGTVRARNQVDVFPEISAPVVEVMVQSGERVNQGQPLIRLRDTEARERLRQAESGLEVAVAQVRQAEANLNQLESRLQRMESLSARNLESEAEMDVLRAQVESSRANHSMAKAQRSQAESVLEERKNDLNNTIVRSPVTGYAGFVRVETGQFVNTSTQLLEVGDTDVMHVRVSLNERMLSYIETGQTVNVSFSGSGDEPVRAQVDRISPFLNPVTNATEAEIIIQNTDGRLKSGMFVTVDILYGESEQAVLVPINAIYTHPADGRRGVYVADVSRLMEIEFDDERERPEIMGPVPVRFVPIQIVAQGRQVTGVRGIESGDYVVTLGQNLLASGRENARIRVIEWERMIELQEMQSRDLLQMIRDKLVTRNGGPIE